MAGAFVLLPGACIGPPRQQLATLAKTIMALIKVMAGACDLLADLGGKGPYIIDWKTSGKSIHSNMDDQLLNYKAQTGAYSLILKHMTGIQAIGGAVVVARRSGEPVTTLINQEELIEQESLFLERAERHFDQLQAHRALISDS